MPGTPAQHQLNFRIAANNDRVGMVAHMAPLPSHGVTDHAEAGDLINDAVHPASLERGAVAAFVPARVHRRATKHAVSQPERRAPPAGPECDADARKQDHRAE